MSEVVKLERDMRQVLLELEMLSHGCTQNWSPTGGGKPGTKEPPGNIGSMGGNTPPHIYWRDRWNEAEANDGNLQRVYEEAKAELDAWKNTPRVSFTQEETGQQFELRLIREGRGWSVEDVAQHFRTTPTLVRRIRVRHSVSMVTGEPAKRPTHEPTDQYARARELAESGMSERQIVMITKLPKTTLRRVLGRAA